MICIIAGTTEGREMLKELNKYTDDILVSTATPYGGELLKDYRYKVLNDKPLRSEEMQRLFVENKVGIVIDTSHPYAIEVSENLMKVCRETSIEYIRLERKGVVEKFINEDKVIVVESYEELYSHLKSIKGNILNTTGSRNLNKILELGLPNRIIHRILPSMKVFKECLDLKVQVEDIIAIKGPISYDLNRAFIKEYNAAAILLKDSGITGGTEEKIKAALDEGIYTFVIQRKTLKYDNVFYDSKEIIRKLEIS
ncbi:MAG: cobalt-precorrin-6A reductase [Peptostreptococcaceae bacterium]